MVNYPMNNLDPMESYYRGQALARQERMQGVLSSLSKGDITLEQAEQQSLALDPEAAIQLGKLKEQRRAEKKAALEKEITISGSLVNALEGVEDVKQKKEIYNSYMDYAKKAGIGVHPQLAKGYSDKNLGYVKRIADIGNRIKRLENPVQPLSPEGKVAADVKAGILPSSALQKEEIPEGVKLPEGTMPIFEDGKFIGVENIPGIENLKPKIDSETVKNESNMRKEFSGITEDFRDIKASYNRIKTTAEKPSPASDLSLIFNYMKMLDPGSVVRESEFQTAATAKPLLQKLGISWDTVESVWEGKKLTSTQRQDFLDIAGEIFNGQTNLYNDTAKRYRDIAVEYGFDPERIAAIEDTEKNNDMNTLPKDAEFVGTSGGKKVYKLQDGSYVMEE